LKDTVLLGVQINSCKSEVKEVKTLLEKLNNLEKNKEKDNISRNLGGFCQISQKNKIQKIKAES